MRDSYKEHITSAVDEFIENTDKGKVLFIKHYNGFYVDDKDILKKVSNKNNIEFLYYKYNNSKIQGPYEPLFMWIRKLYLKYFKEDSIDKFLDNSNIYYLHKSIFKSYIKSGISIRDEEIIISEIKYEQIMFAKSLCNIFNYISCKVPLIIILNELHLSNASIIKFIKEYIKEKNQNKILFVASYNEAYKVNNRFSDDWNKMCKEIVKYNLVVDCRLDGKTDFLDEERYDFFPKDSEFIEYIIQINNMVSSLAYEQALYYLELIYDTKVIEKKEISLKSKQKFLQLYALANLYLGDTSKAILLCDESNELCRMKEAVKDEYANYLFECNYISGIAQICKGQYYIGEDYANKCLEIAEKEKDDLLIFRSKLLSYNALFRGWKGVFLCDVTYSIDRNFLKELRKYNYKNHLAYINIVGYESEFWNSMPKVSKVLTNDIFMEGINIAKKIKNDSFLYLAYNKIILTASIEGNYMVVEEYYHKSLQVAKRLRDKEKQANVLNGLGYNLLGEEKYVEAAEKFNQAITLLYNLESINKIAEVLYNMGINAFLAGKFEDAKELFLNCLEMIEYLRIGCIPICNITKIYGFVGLCNYLTKRYYDCNYYFKKMERILSHLLDPKENPSYMLWDDDLYLYYLLNGIILKLQKEYEKAQESFEKAKIHMEKSTGSLFYAVILLAIEESNLYEEVGNKYKAKQVLRLAADFYKKKKWYKKANILEKFYNKEPIVLEKENLKLRSIESKLLLDASRRIGAEKELKEERKELSFILMWQEVLNKKYISEEELIDNSMELLKNNFFVERILYINISENMKGKIIYNDVSRRLNQSDINTIISFFTKSSREFVICREDKNIDMYKDIINILGKNKVFSIIGIPIFNNAVLKDILIAYIPVYNNFLENKFRLTERHLYIFKYIFKQLLDALNNMKINKKIEDINKQLRKIAITDILTGIYNRQGFERIISKNHKIITILYIDIDDFKIYNDSYGHDVGDFILVSFAKVFKKVAKDKGYAVRYGGDEFIIALENSSNEKAIEIAKNIYKFINTERFCNALKNKIGEKRYKNEKISCSIGIATSTNNTSNGVMEAIMNADKALYEIKKNGKGKYKEWISKKTQEQ